jgi:hypothetical protein
MIEWKGVCSVSCVFSYGCCEAVRTPEPTAAPAACFQLPLRRPLPLDARSLPGLALDRSAIVYVAIYLSTITCRLLELRHADNILLCAELRILLVFAMALTMEAPV